MSDLYFIYVVFRHQVTVQLQLKVQAPTTSLKTGNSDLKLGLAEPAYIVPERGAHTQPITNKMSITHRPDSIGTQTGMSYANTECTAQTQIFAVRLHHCMQLLKQTCVVLIHGVISVKFHNNKNMWLIIKLAVTNFTKYFVFYFPVTI